MTSSPYKNGGIPSEYATIIPQNAITWLGLCNHMPR